VDSKNGVFNSSAFKLFFYSKFSQKSFHHSIILVKYFSNHDSAENPNFFNDNQSKESSHKELNKMSEGPNWDRAAEFYG